MQCFQGTAPMFLCQTRTPEELSLETPQTAVVNQGSAPPRGMSLGWRLSLYTSFFVVLVMGTISVVQEVLETRHELGQIESDLRTSVLPLVHTLETAPDLDEVKNEITRFHQAYVQGGHSGHEISLRDNHGNILFTTYPEYSILDADNFNQAAVVVRNDSFSGNQAQLFVYEDNTDFRENQSARWRRWAVHLVLTLSVILLVMHISIRKLVTGPLERLLEGIRRTEMGYWGESDQVDGAWEIRWINWRFQNMGRELNKTVESLFAAERRGAQPQHRYVAGRPASKSATVTGAQYVISDQTSSPEAGVAGVEAEDHDLLARCERLENSPAATPALREEAQLALDTLAVKAEKLGDMALKARLENAAIRILDAEGFADLEQKVKIHEHAREDRLSGIRQQLGTALQRNLVPVNLLQSRTKHLAGIWMKMRSKGLNLDQIHDLYAVRLVVPSEADCYWALGVVHDTFAPVVGRFKDYIAAPKANGYQSIHTCVRAADGLIFEIQIRSATMHFHAERGSAAHVAYKADGLAGIETFGTKPRRGLGLFSALGKQG